MVRGKAEKKGDEVWEGAKKGLEKGKSRGRKKREE